MAVWPTTASCLSARRLVLPGLSVENVLDRAAGEAVGVPCDPQGGVALNA